MENRPAAGVTGKPADGVVVLKDDGKGNYIGYLDGLEINSADGQPFYYFAKEAADDPVLTAYASAPADGTSTGARAIRNTQTDADGKLIWGDAFHDTIKDAANIASVKNTLKTETASVSKAWVRETPNPDGSFSRGAALTTDELKRIDALGGMPQSILYCVYYRTKRGGEAWGSTWTPLMAKGPDGKNTPVQITGVKDASYGYSKTISDLPAYTVEEMSDGTTRLLEISYRLAEYRLHYEPDAVSGQDVANPAFAGDSDGTKTHTEAELSEGAVTTGAGGSVRSFTAAYTEGGSGKTNTTAVTNGIPVRRLRVVKFWDDQYDRDQTRPKSLVFGITRQGVNTAADTKNDTVTLNAAAGPSADIADPTTGASAQPYSKKANIWTAEITVPSLVNMDAVTWSSYEVTEGAEGTSVPDDHYPKQQHAVKQADGWKWVGGTDAGLSADASDDTAYFLNSVNGSKLISVQPVKTWKLAGTVYDGSSAVPACYQEYLQALHDGGKLSFTLQYRLVRPGGTTEFSDVPADGRDTTDFDEMEGATTQTAQIDAATGKISFANGFTMWKKLPVHENDSSVPDAPRYEYRVVEKIAGEAGRVWTMTAPAAGNSDYTRISAAVLNAETVLASKKPGTLTLDNSLEETGLTIIKTWEDENNAYSLRPDQVSYKVFCRKSGETAYIPVPDRFLTGDASDAGSGTKTAVMAKAGGWRVTVDRLPKYAPDGKLYEYQIEETVLGYGTGAGMTEVPLNSSAYKTDAEASGNRAAATENAAGKPEAAITNKLRTTSLTVKKTWDDKGTDWNKAVTGAKFTLKRKVEGEPDTAYTEVRKTAGAGGAAATVTETMNGHPADGSAVSLTFADLPAFDQNGKAYKYIAVETALLMMDADGAVKEIAAPAAAAGTNSDTAGRLGDYGYEASTNSAGGKFTTDVKNTVILGSVKAVKLWDDDGNRDKLRPDSLTFTLKRQAAGAGAAETVAGYHVGGAGGRDYANDQTVSRNADDAENRKQWDSFAEWKDLPLYAAEGRLYAYTVTESGNTAEYIVNPDSAGKSHSDMEATPKAEGQEEKAVFRNVHKPDTRSVAAMKTFDTVYAAESPEGAADDAIRLRGHAEAEDQPDSVELTLMAHVEGTAAGADYKVTQDEDGAKIENPVTVGKSTKPDAWKYTWKNLPTDVAGQVGRRITYYVVETPENAYREDAKQDLAVRNRYISTELTIRKRWVGDAVFGTADTVSKVAFQIERKSGTDPFTEVAGLTAEIERTGGAEKGEVTIRGLQAYDKENRSYTYRAVETSITVVKADGAKTVVPVSYTNADKTAGVVGGYNYSLTVSEKPGDGKVYDAGRTTYVSEAVNELRTGGFTAGKIWEDESNARGTRPASITFHLLRDGAALEAAFDRVLAGPAFTAAEWAKLPISDAAGEAYSYSVKEDPVPGYGTVYGDTAALSEGGATAAEVTNRLSKIYIRKVDENGAGLPGAGLKLTTADGAAVTLASGENVEDWTSEGEARVIYGIPDGEYVLHEVKVPAHYRAAENISFRVENGHVAEMENDTVRMTDEYVPDPPDEDPVYSGDGGEDKLHIHGSKLWADAGDPDGKRPEAVTLRLYADGVEVKRLTVTGAAGADSWACDFGSYPKYRAGKRISYTLTEDPVEGYAGRIDLAYMAKTGKETQDSLIFAATNTLKQAAPAVLSARRGIRGVATGDESGIVLYAAALCLC